MVQPTYYKVVRSNYINDKGYATVDVIIESTGKKYSFNQRDLQLVSSKCSPEMAEYINILYTCISNMGYINYWNPDQIVKASVDFYNSQNSLVTDFAMGAVNMKQLVETVIRLKEILK